MEKTSRRLRELQAESWEKAKKSLLEEGEKSDNPMFTNPATRESLITMVEAVWSLGYRTGGADATRLMMENMGLGDIFGEVEKSFKPKEQSAPEEDIDENLKRQIDELLRKVSEGN